MENFIEATSKIQELTYELKIRDVMEKDFYTVKSSIKATSLREFLREKKILGVPVVDDGELVGIVSIEDFITSLEQGKLDQPVKEMMTHKVLTLFDDEPLINAVKKFEEFSFHRFPVVEREDAKLVGTLTRIDLIKGILKNLESSYRDEAERRYRASHIFKDIIADELAIELKYHVEGKNFDKAGKASTGLKKTLYRLGVPPDVVRRVTIATYEAEINIVSYTERGVITAYIDTGKIKMKIEDVGPGIKDINKAMQPGYSTAPDWVRELGFGAGMGLPNMKKFSDEMKISSVVGEGTTLQTVFRIKKNKK